MPLILHRGLTEYQFIRSAPGVDRWCLTFQSFGVARSFLQTFLSDSRNLLAIRNTFATEMGNRFNAKISDQQLVDDLALQLAQGTMVVMQTPHIPETFMGPPIGSVEMTPREVEQAAKATPEPQAPPAETPAPAPEPPTLENVNEAAQAEALTQAAEDGAPLCEECEKAKQEQTTASAAA